MEEKLHIVPHQHKISRKERSELKGHLPVVVWFTGLSGSGKSTIADRVEQILHNEGVHSYLLDGDNVRVGLNKGLGFSAEDRHENLRRIAEVGKLMVDAGLVVLSAFVSPLRADRELVRNIIGNEHFLEVYVNTSVEECERRDVKGLYKKARAGEISNFTGVSAPYEIPEEPDLQINTEALSIDAAASLVIEILKQKIFIK